MEPTAPLVVVNSGVVNGGNSGKESTASIIVVDNGNGNHRQLHWWSIVAAAMTTIIDDGRAAKTPLLLQPLTAAADGEGEEMRRPLYRAAVDRLCLLSGSTINGNLERRRTSNQQSTSTAARESNKG